METRHPSHQPSLLCHCKVSREADVVLAKRLVEQALLGSAERVTRL